MDQKKHFSVLAFIVGLCSLAASAALYVITGTFGLPVQIALVVFLIGIGLSVIFDPEKARNLLTGRQGRQGGNLLLLSLSVIGIVAAINFLAFNNPKLWDISEDKTNTLSEESIQALSEMESPVFAQAFFSAQISNENAKKLLDLYKYHGNGKFEYTFINPDADPITAQQANFSRDGSIVLSMVDRSEPVLYVTEEEITGALIRLNNPESKTIYFLTGHGEPVADDTPESPISNLIKILKSKNYQIKSLNLMSSPKIPEDARVIVIASPKQSVSSQELDLISGFLQQKKSLVFLSESPMITENDPSADLLVQFLADTWGIQLNNDLVLDPNINPPVYAVSNAYADHAITNKMDGMATVFPTSHSIELKEGSQEILVTALITTSDSAWGETDVESIKANQVTLDASQDHQGPIALAVSAENMASGARLVVIGDGEFATNDYFQNYGNGDFIINTLDWAAEQENLINLTPRTKIQRMIVPPQQYTMGILLLGLIFILPGSVIVLGIYSWMDRRRRG